MNYSPITGVWEITMGCNMKCKHCGSSCTHALPGELTTEEALKLCDDIAGLGLMWITLSGGEPLIRKDWHLIVQRLRNNGVVPNLITNGWAVTEKILETAKESGIGTLAVSLDGLESYHDYMRKPGAYRRGMNALRMMRDMDISAGVITTVSKKNLPELPAFKDALAEVGVRFWQLQIGLPMGNLKENSELIMRPEDVDDVIDFTYETMLEGKINLYPADCLGYYNIKELKVRQAAHKTPYYPTWKGCNAGKRSLGILHDGSILGCTSIRDRQFIEGSIKDRSLRDIWEDENSFTWNRNAKKSKLEGLCKTCKYGDDCLGGCPNTRLTMNKRIDSENEYCSYNVAMKKTNTKIAAMNDFGKLSEMGRDYAHKGEYQLSSMVLKRALELQPDNVELLSYYGFINFFLSNFEESRVVNEKVIAIDPDNAYAYKGLGLVLYKSGEMKKSIECLEKAINLAGDSTFDPYHDLAVIYIERGMKEEAKKVLERAKTLSTDFARQAESLYHATA